MFEASTDGSASWTPALEALVRNGRDGGGGVRRSIGAVCLKGGRPG